MQKVLKFEPIYKEKVWGGRKLETVLGRKIPAGEIGESWEISDYGSDLSVITNGEFAGKTFREVYLANPDAILGKAFKGKEFPLLIKLIDAKEKLSVQVHPDDAYAEEFDPESSGKKEAWTVLQADPGSKLVCGFSRQTDREEFSKYVEANRVEEILNEVEVESLDSFLLNPGRIHAIGGGILLMEVQQSSDSTYRVYDYGRPRELHLKKALDVLDYSFADPKDRLIPKKIQSAGYERSVLTSNDKFRMEILETNSNEGFSLPSFAEEPVFHVLMVIEGKCDLEGIVLQKGDTVLITAFGIKNGIECKPQSPKLRLAWSGPGTDWSDNSTV
ncbi:mannose-6-phosphate isomerase [Leptospira semungkisensis]|uniref:Mannose-6-phosphate isomerase n=1 Tax=Leptospira semungkisensis TaxID=2484985 RepID=A0A4R9G853_9LEPT|nr:type I phosphomannose isomerase catalytic subunit [Leptospira semungkisensis]TGK07671.1 mannose-6-phosphate isomerase [Leptospira semungkisensis]